MDDCPHKRLKRQNVGNQHWYVCGVEIFGLSSALRNLRDEFPAGGITSTTEIRRKIDALLEKFEESGCGQKFLCEPWDGKVKVERHLPNKCISCGKQTDYCCADCMIDKKEKVYVCGRTSCRDQHERNGCTRVGI